MRRKPLLALALLAFGSAGCGKILGVDEYRIAPPPAKDAGSPSIIFRDQKTCGACVTTACGSELDQCRQDSLCARWERCMANCTPGDGTCEHRCFTNAGQTNQPMGVISACTLQKCSAQCKATGIESAYSAKCSAATRTNCQSQLSACAGDANCLKFTRCLFETNCLTREGAGASLPDSALSGVVGNPACAWQCEDRVRIYEPSAGTADGGLAPNPTMATALCTYGNDLSDCDFLGSLACVGDYRWPQASASTIDVTVFVNDGGYAEVPGTPMAGIPVRACQQQSVDCAPEYGSQTTDKNGRATFTIEAAQIGFTGYFEVTPNWPNGPSKLLYVAGRRLTEDTLLSLATDAFQFAHLKEPGNAWTFGSFGVWSSDRGALMVQTKGCDGFPAFGLEIRVDGGGDGGAPSIEYFTGTGPTLTPSGSTAGANILSVEPGVRTVSAYKGGELVAQEQVVVRADQLTIMYWLEPRRRPGPGE